MSDVKDHNIYCLCDDCITEFQSIHAWHTRKPELEAVAWRCKDSRGGWFIYQNVEHAEAYQKASGCIMQPLFVKIGE